MKINFLITVNLMVLMLVLSGCEKATIVDLIHPETENDVDREILLTKDKYEKYRVGDVLFIPYTNHVTEEDDKQEYETYILQLSAYKKQESASQVVVNSVSVKGNKIVKFRDIEEVLNMPLNFTEKAKSPSLVKSWDTLVDVLSEENMNLTEESAITVVLNVSVTQNGNTLSRDLSYEFVPKFRTYMVSR
ncbi:hypothetical protein FZW96_21225 [Bacillus sp. BGMRC 2118]|nr:hypothetical protein FZW96_21225 [Bacillus sp. BGMRC 2118]